jgi:ABC-type transport system involved in multi-copper enzyme maturation permease subunit
MASGLEPWDKAGIIVKASTAEGSAYAAMMVTGSHGVRMQWNYTHDTPGLAGSVSAASPRWLRLVRSGDTVTGYDSADGTRWTRVGAATLAGLPATAQTGLFAASPGHSTSATSLGGSTETGAPGFTTGVFDHVSLSRAGTGPWTGTALTSASQGTSPVLIRAESFRQAAGAFTVTGTGDIGPAPPGGSGSGPASLLTGLFAALIAVTVIAVMFITAEYRRGLIRLTFSATPRRGRTLAAKAAVIGVVTFAVGLAAIAVTVPLGERLLRANGNVIEPLSVLTQVRVEAGLAALLAVAAVLALAIGALLRSGAAAVATALAVIVLPYILGTFPGLLPPAAEDWVLRLTPAAAFAVQQTSVTYPQVTASYTPSGGYFPLAPWAGFAVLCAWTALALAAAAYLLRRRDA